MRESDVEAVLDALRSGWLTMGPRIQAFEAQFAAHVGAAHAVAVSSGTAAVHLAVRAVAASRVAVPALGGDAAAAAVRAFGGEVLLWDPPADPPPDAEALVVAHAFGTRAQVPAVEVPVVEDCRAALGLGVGRAGVAACWSFADGRPLAMGEGGCLTTDDEAIAARVRLLRQHAMTSGTWDRHRGHSDSYDVVDIGFNFRLDEPRAALGSSQLAHLTEARSTVEAIRVDDVDAAVEALREAGIGARGYTPLAPLPHAAEAAARLVLLEPGADREAVARALCA